MKSPQSEEAVRGTARNHDENFDRHTMALQTNGAVVG